MHRLLRTVLVTLLATAPLRAPLFAQSSSSSSKQVRKPPADSPLNSAAVSNGVYRDPAFGFICKIPAGWVLRTEEMNARDDQGAKPDSAQAATNYGQAACVLRVALLRPPGALAA